MLGRSYVYVSAFCPLGTSFYSCESNKFRGCCATDPCTQPNSPRDVAFFEDSDEIPDEPSIHSDERTSTSNPSKTKTDSGVTHTIPNDSVVTVTKHTVVFSEVPSSTSVSSNTLIGAGDNSSSNATPTLSGQQPVQTDSSTTANESHGVSSGAIVGAAIGGISIMAIVMVLVFWWKRKRKNRDQASSRHHDSDDTRRAQTADVDEKYFPTQVSPQTTGTEEPRDPFAPFGGRIDRPDDPHRPRSGAFEMDGTDIAPVELPDTSIQPTRIDEPSVHQPVMGTTQPSPTTANPAANLASPDSKQGGMNFVNHWNQYKALAEESDAETTQLRQTVV